MTGRSAVALMSGLFGITSATGACSRGTQVAGRVDTEDARQGIRCEVALKDPGYKDGRSLGSLAIRTGEEFHGILLDPERSPLAPASREQYVTVTCEGYAQWNSPMFERQTFTTQELGTIRVVRQTD